MDVPSYVAALESAAAEAMQPHFWSFCCNTCLTLTVLAITLPFQHDGWQGEAAVDVPSCVAALESAVAEAIQQGLHLSSKALSTHIQGTGKGNIVLRQGSGVNLAHMQHAHSRNHSLGAKQQSAEHRAEGHNLTRIDQGGLGHDQSLQHEENVQAP